MSQRHSNRYHRFSAEMAGFASVSISRSPIRSIAAPGPGDRSAQRAADGGPGLLAGKKAVLCAARGGAHGTGTLREGWDHSTRSLRRIIGDVVVPI